MDITSSTAGAAVALQQGLAQQSFNVSALNQTAQQQQQAVTTLLGGGDQFSSSGGGNVTPTRGQNLNITV